MLQIFFTIIITATIVILVVVLMITPIIIVIFTFGLTIQLLFFGLKVRKRRGIGVD